MVIVPYGFILPFKTNGGLKLIDVSTEPPSGPYTITDDSRGQWFYHRTRWHDMDGDGDLDAVTCHAREPIFGSYTLFSFTFLRIRYNVLIYIELVRHILFHLQFNARS